MESTAGKNWTEEDEKLLLETIDKWVENEVKPIAREYDQEDKYPHELVESMKDLGLFGATISPEYGGMGLPASVYAKVIIKVASVWMAPSGIFNSHLIMASAIERCGTDEQKTNWLPKMASGEFRGGIALTEPNAGTDLQAILTRADRNEQGYLLNGTKMWITNSMYGNCLLVLAKTDLKAKPAHKGMSAFLCQKNEGYDVSKKLKKLGYRSIDSCELTLVDKQVSSDALLSGEEGRGLQQVLGGLELGRINVAALQIWQHVLKPPSYWWEVLPINLIRENDVTWKPEWQSILRLRQEYFAHRKQCVFLAGIVILQNTKLNAFTAMRC